MMLQLSARNFAGAIVAFSALAGGTAPAADLIPAQTRLVGLTGAPQSRELAFTIATTTDLVVTLTDLKTPAALSSASIVVTQADGVVGMASLAPPATTATVALDAAQGDFTIRVIGAPDPNFSVGTFTACVAPKTDPSNCIQTASFSDNILSQSASNDVTLSTLSLTLTVTAAGTYTFNFADLAFPAALNNAPNIALFQGSTPVPGGLAIASGTPLNLNTGTYTLLAFAQADQTLKAGLWGITIVGPSGNLLDNTIPVGLMPAAAPVRSDAAQTATLKVSDFGFPAPVDSASALVTSGGTSLGSASAAGGAVTVSVPAAPLQVWTFASSSAGSGTYAVDLTAGGASLYSNAQAVNQAGGSSVAYAFTTTVTAGAYQAGAADLQFPSSLTGLSFAVAQNGTVLSQSTSASPVNFTAADGPLVLLVNAQTPASGSANGNGLFDVNVQTTGASASLVYDMTQSVGVAPALFDSQSITLGTNGSFDVTLTDLKFPAQFGNLALVVSRGTEVLGKIFGGGTFTFAGTPGKYQVTFIATPASDQKYGLYSIKGVVSAPVISLSASASTVVAGDSVKLSWSAAGADSCTASGGNWTGGKAIAATDESVVVDATTTYTLSCTGAGGTSEKSVSVTATPKPASTKSGGGAMEWNWILMLAGLLLWRNRPQHA